RSATLAPLLFPYTTLFRSPYSGTAAPAVRASCAIPAAELVDTTSAYHIASGNAPAISSANCVTAASGRYGNSPSVSTTVGPSPAPWAANRSTSSGSRVTSPGDRITGQLAFSSASTRSLTASTGAASTSSTSRHADRSNRYGRVQNPAPRFTTSGCSHCDKALPSSRSSRTVRATTSSPAELASRCSAG